VAPLERVRAGADTRAIMELRPKPATHSVSPSAPAPETTGLEFCPACGSDFVNAVKWEPVYEHAWWILLRCGECAHFGDAIVSNAVAERFDEELDRRADPIASAAHRLELERMAAEVGAVMVALQHDLIDADDFAR